MLSPDVLIIADIVLTVTIDQTIGSVASRAEAVHEARKPALAVRPAAHRASS